MDLLLKLAYAFFKIGLLTVGGGLAMIPIVQHEMVSRGWLDSQQFLDILGIAEMTPGPMAVNTATFVGYRVMAAACPQALGMALAGAVVGTVAVSLPSLLCVNLFGGFWARNREHPCLVTVFSVLRPVVAGLVGTAALLLVVNCLWNAERISPELLRAPDWRAAAWVAAAFSLTVFSKVSPVCILLAGAAAGLVCGALGV